MKAYFVHDIRKETDLIIVPELDTMLAASRSALELFIAPRPDFSCLKGTGLNRMAPEAFGRVVATRETEGDVCVADPILWPKRMSHHLRHQR